MVMPLSVAGHGSSNWSVYVAEREPLVTVMVARAVAASVTAALTSGLPLPGIAVAAMSAAAGRSPGRVYSKTSGSNPPISTPPTVMVARRATGVLTNVSTYLCERCPSVSGCVLVTVMVARRFSESRTTSHSGVPDASMSVTASMARRASASAGTTMPVAIGSPSWRNAISVPATLSDAMRER